MEGKFNAKLQLWQERLADSNREYAAEYDKMDQRERQYNGEHKLKYLVEGDLASGTGKETKHVRNITFENIESQVSSAIPQPKVTPKHKEDEALARNIERFLRNELDRLPFEEINDMAERTVPLQGGTAYLIEWDNTVQTHCTVGQTRIVQLHPKQLAPQPGIYTSIEDMDWIIIKLPTTKEAIKRKYGVIVDDESEAEPNVRGDAEGTAEDAVTQYVGYERNDEGGINRYSWVNDIELEDLDNYQARRQPVCSHCGRVKPLPGQMVLSHVHDNFPEITPDITDEDIAGQMIAQQLANEFIGEGTNSLESIMVEPDTMQTDNQEPVEYNGGPCPWCGSEEWEDRTQDFEQVVLPFTNSQGLNVPGMTPGFNEDGLPAMQPTSVPFYKPNSYPIILQRSVSIYGQLLGNSDADMIADQQNTTNRLEQKIIDRLMEAGTRITLPDRANFRVDPKDHGKWYIANASDKNLIDVYEFKGNLQYEMAYLSEVYEEARQILGITNSFQGREDSTATSGKAKQFSAAQAAGRLDSKRKMKERAYSCIFEMMFKFWLAYADEPRQVVYKNYKGENEYTEFSRYDFLKQDEDGQYYWDDEFMFSVDNGSANLSTNRENMWTETRNNLSSGAFGDPTQIDTLILFWSKMEELHYPGADTTKQYLEDKLQQQQMQQMMMQQQQMQQQAMQQQQAVQQPQISPGPSDAIGQ